MFNLLQFSINSFKPGNQVGALFENIFNGPYFQWEKFCLDWRMNLVLSIAVWE